MFSDLKKGFQVHTLDTNTVPNYSDGFPKVFKCENELVKATLMYLDDPDAPEGVAFIRWLAVQDYLGEKINWKDLT